MKRRLSLGSDGLKILVAPWFSIVGDDDDIALRGIKVEVREDRTECVDRGIEEHGGRLDILRHYAILAEVLLDYLVKLLGQQLKRHERAAVGIDQDQIIEARRRRKEQPAILLYD